MRKLLGAVGITVGFGMVGVGVIADSVSDSPTEPEQAVTHLGRMSEALYPVETTTYDINGRTISIELPRSPDTQKVKLEAVAASNALVESSIDTACLENINKRSELSRQAATQCIANTLNELQQSSAASPEGAPLPVTAGILVAAGGLAIFALSED